MNTTFDPARSAALRQQLGALPATDPVHRTVLRRRRDKPEEQPTHSAQPEPTKRRRAPWIIGGTGVAVTAALLASVPFQPGSTSGADFIPAMARPQQPEDLLPEDLRERAGDLDVETSRLVGTERGRSYYAVESIDAQMCLVVVEPVLPPGEEQAPAPWLIGCTLLQNFDGYPLQIVSPATKSKVWLVSANIEPTERQLTEQERLSPNLYIEYTDDIPLTPGDEGYEYEPSWP